VDLNALKELLQPLSEGIKWLEDGQARQAHTQERQVQDIKSMSLGVSHLAENDAR
jgi:hypothetical protein